MPRAVVCPIDLEWLAAEGRQLGASASTPRRALIVGGSGHVGLNLVALLGNSPACKAIRVLDVNPPMPKVVQGISKPLEFVQFRLGTDSPAGLGQHLEGIDCVFSALTPHVQFATAEDFYSSNLVGVQQLVQACIDASLPRLVHLSSIAVSNHFKPSVNQNEAHPLPRLDEYKSPYDISKRRGAMAVIEANGKGGLKTCSLRAGGIMCGTRDYLFSNIWPILPGIIMAPTGKVKVDFIDARDVARACVVAAQALEEGRSGIAGEDFWLTKGEALIPCEIAAVVAEELGLRFLGLPNCTLFFVAIFGWLWHQLKRLFRCKLSGVLPHWFLQMANIEQTFDNSKIKEKLGFHTKVPMREAIIRICNLYKLEIGS